MSFFLNLYYLLLIPILTIFLLFSLNNKQKNNNKLLIVIFTTGLFGSLLYACLFYLFFKLDNTFYQNLTFLIFNPSFLSEWNQVISYYLISTSLLAIDSLSILFIIMTPFIIGICAALTHQLPLSGDDRRIYYVLLLLIELFLFLAFSTMNLLVFYFAFEAVLLPIFLIIGKWGSNNSRKQAANYIFIYTVAGSILILFAILSIIKYYGTANFTALKTMMDTQTNHQISFWWWCFFIGFAVKIPMCPFHLWLPEAHVEAPAAGSVILAALLLKLGGYGFFRVLIEILSFQTVIFQNYALLLGLLSVIWGCGIILTLTDIKRIIAFSSIIHMNLAVLGIFSLNYYGLLGAIAVMISHGFCSAGLFMCIGMLYIRYHTRTLPTLTGLAKIMPVFSLLFGFYSVANMAFPGTFNFVAELLLLQGIFLNNSAVAFICCYAVIFSGVYSLGLFSRLVLGTVTTSFTKFYDVSALNFVPSWYTEFCWQLPLIFIILFWGIFPKYFLELVDLFILKLLC